MTNKKEFVYCSDCGGYIGNEPTGLRQQIAVPQPKPCNCKKETE